MEVDGEDAQEAPEEDSPVLDYSGLKRHHQGIEGERERERHAKEFQESIEAHQAELDKVVPNLKVGIIGFGAGALHCYPRRTYL